MTQTIEEQARELVSTFMKKANVATQLSLPPETIIDHRKAIELALIDRDRMTAEKCYDIANTFGATPYTVKRDILALSRKE